MKAITLEKHFCDLSKEEQQDINELDLRELKGYYGSWDEVRKLIDQLEDNDNEAAYERFTNRDKS